jgi:uncharacterized protein (DUF488 family)
MHKVFTIGYGGRGRDDFLALLKANGVRTLVDIRLRPDRASMGIWVKARTPDKGIEKWLADAGIAYRSLIELGNVFMEFPDWQERFRRLLASSGELLVERLEGLEEPICLMCAEKRAADCHRREVAVFLAQRTGAAICHIE